MNLTINLIFNKPKMTTQQDEFKTFYNQRKVLNELLQNSKCEGTQDKEHEDRVNMDFGDLTINGVTYSVNYSYKSKCKSDSSKESSFNEQLYKHTSKILTASIISMYFGKVDVNSVTLSLVGYFFGERIFPILVTNYSLNYAYRYLTLQH